MPQDKKPGLHILIGIGKPKASSPPPKAPWDDESQGGAPPQEDGEAEGAKVGPDEAGCFGPDLRCSNCEYFQPGDNPDLGDCSKVDGPSFGPAGHINGCLRFFEPRSEGGADQDETPPAGAQPSQGPPTQ